VDRDFHRTFERRISGLILNHVGDAARYLNPSPPNIEMRRRIRAEGVELLRRLHKCELYDRITLVGHSLGSVIAYDIIRNLWPEYNTVHARLAETDQKALRDLEGDGKKIAANPKSELADKFRIEQSALWKEQRRQGNPWLVTDLITMPTCPCGVAARSQ
jgi:surfactin synthase thioesterase subunit